MDSNIKNFFFGKVLLVTGATGFLGKTLIEKLLRSCDGINRIYILLRQKKSKSAKERAQEYFSDPIFDLKGLNDSGILYKIEPIYGDILLPDLGISSEDREVLIKSVNIVIHLAAIVKLDAPFRYAVQRNLKPIKSLVELCHKIERLDCLVYSSTIALLNRTDNCRDIVDKNLSISPELVIQLCDNCSDKELNELIETHFSQYNNTYCISKALSEQVLLQNCSQINISIIRPSAILPAYKEPNPGWVQGKQINGIGLLIGLGILRVLPFLETGAQCVIPVDYVVNAIIASAWFVSNQNNPGIHVYNLTTKSDYSLSIRDLLSAIKSNAIKFPSKRVIRAPDLTFTTNDIEFCLRNFGQHWMFAYFIDFVSRFTGRKQRLVSIIQEMNNNFVETQKFINTSPEFEVKNVFKLNAKLSKIDKKEFGFDVRNIEWNSYTKNIWLGIRRHLLKEKDSNYGRAKKNFDRIVLITKILELTVPSIFVILIILFFSQFLKNIIA